MNHRYRRVWVVQEYLLAQEIQWIAAGVILPPWLMHKAVESLQSIMNDEPLWEYCGFIDVRAAGRHIQRLFSQRKARMHGHHSGTNLPSLSLVSCLFVLSVGRECKDPTDKLYALLAVTEDDLDIKSDYSLSTSAVFVDFAIRSLLKGDLTLLHASGLHPGIEDGSSSLAPWITNSDYVTNPLDIPELRFRAGSMFPAKVSAFAPDMVSISGVRVGPLSHSMALSDLYYWDFARWFISKRTTPGITDCNVERLSYDQLDALGPMSPYTGHNLRSSYELVTTLEAPNKDKFLIESGRFSLNPTPPPTKRWQKDCTIFMTEQGYLSLGPSWKLPNDQVVIFDGVPNPVLLRKVATKDGIDHWHLVGEC